MKKKLIDKNRQHLYTKNAVSFGELLHNVNYS